MSFLTIRDKKNGQIAHRRMVAGRGILRNLGRNNNSPATGQNGGDDACFCIDRNTNEQKLNQFDPRKCASIAFFSFCSDCFCAASALGRSNMGAAAST